MADVQPLIPMMVPKRTRLDPESPVKLCCGCKLVLPRSEFHKWSYSADGLQTYCRKCRTAYNKEDYKKKKEADPDFMPKQNKRIRENVLSRTLRHYNVTVEEYERLAAAGCQVCGGPPVVGGRYAFDHDHDTGEFRGLLCSPCNAGIGFFQNDAEKLRQAADYLDAYYSQE